MLQASRYLTFGRLDVMTEEGRRLRPVFLSTSARTFLLDSDVALALQEGRLSAIATTAVQELSAAGLVVADNEDELAGVLRASKDAIQANRTRYLVLMPTAWCNMGCEYCGQRHNSHLAGQFAQEMTDAGFTDTRVLFYPAVVHEWGNDVSDFQMTLMKYAEVELEWLRQLSVHGLSLPLIPTETKPIVCLAVDVRGEVIDPAGNIFSCTEEPLIKGALSRRIGQLSQVAEGDRRPRGAYDDWLDSVSNGETGCRECRILPICGGACPKAWRSGNPPCPALKLNLTDRLDLYAQAYSRA